MDAPQTIPAGEYRDVNIGDRTMRICGPATYNDFAAFFPDSQSFLVFDTWNSFFNQHWPLPPKRIVLTDDGPFAHLRQ